MPKNILTNLASSSVSRVLRAIFSEKLWSLKKYFDRSLSVEFIDDKVNFIFLYYPNSIADSQVYPFFRYRAWLSSILGVRFSALEASKVDSLPRDTYSNIVTVCVQADFRSKPSYVSDLLVKISRRFPIAKVVFFDWYAPNDLRFISVLDPFIHRYVKKSVFTDMAQYRCENYGDTNLMDYYGRRYGCKHLSKRYDIPDNLNDKLVIGAGFLTSPYLSSLFESRCCFDNERPIDLNARITSTGSDWYRQMRAEAILKVNALSPSYTVVTGKVSLYKYLLDLARSKITFSPFGYGEVCWRDYEAFALGSLLLKPDMGHLKTNPKIFIPYETYVPIRWDYSDFEEKFMYCLLNSKERQRIAKNAFDIGHNFSTKQVFLEHVKQLL